MSYTVLARKYRSQTFDDVVGQDPIAQTLKNAIKTGKVAHAYLFTGTRGIGKTTMARILAKALNCLAVDQPTTEPCCKCQSCLAVNAGDDIDVIEIDGASNNGVEEVRRLRENAVYRPARARFKIYIIDEVHMLSTSAFNALLKILEEPPSHVKFIFATTEPNKVIATIQSRCQRFDFRNISPAIIAQQLKSILKQEKINCDDDLIMALAKMANGSMRDALSLLDRLISTGEQPLTASLLEKYLGCPNTEKVHNLIAKIGDSDAAGTLAAIDDLIAGGISEPQIIDALTDYMRDLMVIKSAGADTNLAILTDQQRKQAAELLDKFDIAALVYNIATLEKIRWSIRNSDTARALLEASLLRLALAEHFLNIDQLLAAASGKPKAPAAPIKKNLASIADPTRSDALHSPKPTRPQQDARDTFFNARETTIPEPLVPAKRSEDGRDSSHESQVPATSCDIAPALDNWPQILELIGQRLVPATAALLQSALPAQFEDGVLTLRFPASARMQKQLCQSNGRTEQIESLLAEHLGRTVRLKLEVLSSGPQQPAQHPEIKTLTQRRNELINDPAVRTILAGLDATITGIEEDQ